MPLNDTGYSYLSVIHGIGGSPAGGQQTKCTGDKSVGSKYYGEGKSTLVQYSCLENPVDGGAW